jgi:hypothetical protein
LLTGWENRVTPHPAFFQWDRRELQLVVLALPFSLRKKWDRRGCRGTAWRCRYDWLRIVITLQGVE